MKNKFKLILAFLCLSSSIFAQLGSEGAFDAKSFGLAKTYNAVSNGVYSIGINPANLAAFSADKVEIATILPLPSFSIKAGTNFITINDINYFFGKQNGQARVLTDGDKQRLMDLFADGGTGSASMTINLFMMKINFDQSFGTITFSINDVVSARFNIPSSIPELALYGNPAGKVFDFSSLDAKSWYLRSYALSYARRIFTSSSYPYDILTAGVTVKYVQGFYYAGTSRVNSTLSTGTSNQIQGTADYVAYSAFSGNFGVKYDFDSVKTKSSFSLFPDPAGTGTGFDLGVSAFLGDTWRLSFAITDIGKIKWTQNAAQFTATGSIYLDDITNSAQRDSLKDKIVGKSKKIDSFETNLPTALRIGISNHVTSSLMIAFDYNVGFNDMPGNSVKARYSIGCEWDLLNWLPYIRSGGSFGGYYGFGWALGAGFRLFNLLDINLATSDFNSFAAPNKAKYLSVALDTKWNF